MFNNFFNLSSYPILISFVVLLIINLAYSQQNIDLDSENLYPDSKENESYVIVIDDDSQKPLSFVLEIFVFLSGYNYQEELSQVRDLLVENVADSIGVPVLNYYGIGTAFGLSFPIIKNKWYHNGYIVIDVSGTSFSVDNLSYLLTYMNYGLSYRHRFYFLTKINQLLPFAGISPRVDFSLIYLDNLNGSSDEPYGDLNINFSGAIETGIAYKYVRVWLEYSYGRINRLSDRFGVIFNIGIKI